MSNVESNKSVKEKLKEAKRNLDAKIEKAIADYKAFKQACKQAKSVGYNSGKTDYDKLNNKTYFERRSAVRGYGNALSDSAKRDKYKRKLNNSGNRNLKRKK